MSDEMVRIHIWMYKSDIERIHQLFDGKVKVSEAVRIMVNKFLANIEHAASANNKPLGGIDVEP